MERILTSTKKKLDDGFSMKYLIYGSDILSRQKKVKELSSGFLKKGLEVVEFSDASFDEQSFLNYILSDNMFGSKTALVLQYCLSSKEVLDFLESKKREIEETDTVLIFVESEFLKKDFPSFKKSFTEIFEFKKDKEVESKKDNIFSLIDAIVSKNKKKAWILFQEAIDRGVSAEEIINLLFWQYKVMALVSRGGSATTLSMKPFVYSKAKSFLSSYSEKDLRERMFLLISLFQDSRFEKDGVERLERIILS